MPIPSLTRLEWWVLASAVAFGIAAGALAFLLPAWLMWVTLGSTLGLLVGLAAIAASRLRRSTRRLDSRTSGVGADLATLTTSIDRISANVSRLSELVSGTADKAHEAIRQTREEVDSVRTRVDALTRSQDQTSKDFASRIERLAPKASMKDLEKRLAILHRLTALSAAHRLSTHEYPEQLILLMTVERSGSTALFDLLRSHPRVYFEPLSFLWEGLGLNGRRYPTNLSDSGRYTMPVEVQPGVGAQVPLLEPDLSNSKIRPVVAVEKAHPQFVDYDPQALMDGIGRIENLGTSVELILQVRNPLEVMWSIVEYKARQPNWYRDLSPAAVPEYVLRSFQGLARFAHDIPRAQVIDHTELTEVSAGLVEFVEKVGQVEGEATESWIVRTLQQIRLSQRTTPFASAEHEVRRIEGPNDVWVQEAPVINEALALWRELASEGRLP